MMIALTDILSKSDKIYTNRQGPTALRSCHAKQLLKIKLVSEIRKI